MKFFVPIMSLVIFAVLLLYLLVTIKDNNKNKRKIELMEYQISTINRIINNPDQGIQVDQQAYEEADYSVDQDGNKILVYYAKMKNVQDASIVIDSSNYIKRIGFYKP